MVALGNAVPSLPGAIGIFEAFLVGALTLVSGDQDTSLAVALVSHFFNYIVTGLIGAYALSTEGETLMGVYRQLRKSRLSLQPDPVGMGDVIPGPPDNPTLPADPLPDKSQPGMGLGKKE